LIEQTGLIYLHGCIELYYGDIFLSKPYCSLGTQNDSVIFSSPIEAKNDVYALGIRMMRFARKSTPLMVILTAGHICFVLISPLGELTSIVYFIIVMGR
jgi:hypothetical protein